MNDEDGRNDRSEIIRRVAPYMGLGMMFAVSLLLFSLLGYWGDQKLGTEPWLTITGVFTGLVVGFYNFIVVVLRNPPG